MNYTIRQVSQSIDITEQGLYKRINNNLEEYKQKKFITFKKTEKRTQILVTEKGIKELLKTRAFRSGAELKGFNLEEEKEKEVTTESEQKKETIISGNDREIIEILKEQIQDLKTENKRLNEKMDKQQEKYQEQINKLIFSFNQTLEVFKQLPVPPEETETEKQNIIQVKAEQKKEGKFKSFINNIFKK